MVHLRHEVTGVGSTDVELGVGVGVMELAVEVSELAEGDGVGVGMSGSRRDVLLSSRIICSNVFVPLLSKIMSQDLMKHFEG